MKGRGGGGLHELWGPNSPIAPHRHLSTTTNQLMKRTKSDIIPNLTIVNVHWSRALEVKDHRIRVFPQISSQFIFCLSMLTELEGWNSTAKQIRLLRLECKCPVNFKTSPEGLIPKIQDETSQPARAQVGFMLLWHEHKQKPLFKKKMCETIPFNGNTIPHLLTISVYSQKTPKSHFFPSEKWTWRINQKLLGVFQPSTMLKVASTTSTR